MLWTIITLFVAYKLVTWALSRIRIKDYDGKHVLITGCDSGFGNLLTKRLDGLGFSIFATCLTSEGASRLQKECSERVTTFLLDVSDEKSITNARQLVEKALPTGKGLWGLVNNAGVTGQLGPSEWLTSEDWTRCLSVNLFGVIHTTRVFLPLLREGGGGRVVNMSSMMGRIAAGPAPYCVSKYGVEAFSDTLRRETYSQGIKVCMLEPGYFKTDILNLSSLMGSFQTSYDKTPEDIRKHYPFFSLEKFTKLMQLTRERASDDVHLVVDAQVLALTSKFPPTRQLVGYDCSLLGRVLWNLPAPLTDWILYQSMKQRF
ncbi:hypothetical protein ACOMHN_062289 [Nucella lapillus]